MKTNRSRKRRGLAPVEFVLWLPILLFVMALMVNYGTMAAWRIRGEIAAHDAGWRTRWPRTGGGEPDVAPPTAVVTRTETVIEQPGLASLDPPQLRMPVVRGPLPNGYRVNPVLNPLLGSVAGNAHVERQYPLLRKIGSYESGPINDPILHSSWTNSEMGIPNVFRRIKVLYALPQTNAHYPEAFQRAVVNLLSIRDFAALSVLDNDSDWLEYRGSAPDFHPRVRPRCTLSRDEMWEREVRRLVDIWIPRDGKWALGAISTLPGTLTSRFLSLYESTLEQFIAELHATPPPSPAREAYLEREIPELRTKIRQLEQFKSRLDDFYRTLRERGPGLP